MADFTVCQRHADGAILFRIRRSIGARLVHRDVHRPADQLGKVPAGHAADGLVGKCDLAVGIQTADALTGRVKNLIESFLIVLEFFDRRLGITTLQIPQAEVVVAVDHQASDVLVPGIGIMQAPEIR